MADNINQIRDEIRAIGEQKMALREVEQTWKNLNNELKQNKGLYGAALKTIKDKVKALEDEFDSVKNLKKLQKEINDEQTVYIKLLNKAVVEKEKMAKLGQTESETNKEITDELEQQLKYKKEISKRTQDLLKPNEELLDLQNSIANTLGRESAEYGILKKKIEGQDDILKSISERMEDLGDGSERQKELALQAAEAYKEQHVSASTLKKELDKGNITQKQYNKSVMQMSDYWDDIINKIDTSTDKGKDLHGFLKSVKEESISDAKAQMKAPAQNHGIKAAGAFVQGVAGQSGTPLLGEAGSIGSAAMNYVSIRKLSKKKGMEMGDTVEGAAATGNVYMAIAAAAVAVVGASAKLTPIYSTMLEAQKTIVQQTADTSIEMNNLALSIGRIGPSGRNFVEELANVNFKTEMLGNGFQFAADSATSFFGEALSGLKNYSGAQLQLAGISAQTVGNASSLYSSLAGIGDNDIITGLTVASKRLGLSDDAMSNMVTSAKLLDNVNSNIAANLVNASQKFAIAMKLNVGAFMKNYSDASKNALFYGIQTTKELQQQVAYVTKLGLDFNKIAESQKNSVLNYQSQIDGERELESLLGTRIDLSQYRYLSSIGDKKGAIEELRNNPQLQALNPNTNPNLKNNQFARDAEQRLFGMEYQDITKMFAKGFVDQTQTPTKNLGESLADTNNKYLSAFQSAMNSLKVNTAVMQVGQALISTQLQGQQKIQETAFMPSILTQATAAGQLFGLNFRQLGAFTADAMPGAGTQMLNMSNQQNGILNNQIKAPYKFDYTSPFLQPGALSQVLTTGNSNFQNAYGQDYNNLNSNGKQFIDVNKGLQIHVTVDTGVLAGKVVDVITLPTNQLSKRQQELQNKDLGEMMLDNGIQ